MSTHPSTVRAFEALYTAEAFTRLDEEPDAGFYARDRMVEHLDEVALATVERLIGALAIAPRPTILDLMASVDSHLPSALAPAEVVGLGLNERELAANDALTERVIHDLNRDPRLPFEDARFDLVVNTVSVDYLTRPLEVFAEVGRVLKPDARRPVPGRLLQPADAGPDDRSPGTGAGADPVGDAREHPGRTLRGLGALAQSASWHSLARTTQLRPVSLAS